MNETYGMGKIHEQRAIWQEDENIALQKPYAEEERRFDHHKLPQEGCGVSVAKHPVIARRPSGRGPSAPKHAKGPKVLRNGAIENPSA